MSPQFLRTKGQTLAAAKIYTTLRNALPDKRQTIMRPRLKAIENKDTAAIVTADHHPANGP
jgi:hypothetical protein